MGAGQSSAVLTSAMREYRTTAGLSELILLDMEWNQDARPPRRGARAQQWGWNRPGRLLTWGSAASGLSHHVLSGAIPRFRSAGWTSETASRSTTPRPIDSSACFATSAART